MTFSPTRFIAALRRFPSDPAFCELLRFCAPALFVGLILRAALTAAMPHAYVQYDSSDFLITTKYWLDHHFIHIHSKRSFLTPILFTIPFVLQLKPLLVIPLAQHLSGLWGTLIVGSLVRSWFRWWKIAIVPVTVLFAASPWIIWYEHTIMGEAQYLFFTLAMVWAGTLMARRPGHFTFAVFVCSLFLVMGTRLEAKLYFAFAFMLVTFVFWKQWRLFATCLGVLTFAAIASYLMSGKREGSGLAYATLIKLTPDRFASEPGVEPYILPIRDDMRRKFPDYPADFIKIDKAVEETLDGYISQSEPDAKKWKLIRARILRNLCIEALKAHPVEALILPWTKFCLATDAWSAYVWDEDALGPMQQEAATLKDWTSQIVGLGATGRRMTKDEASEWVAEHYDAKRVAWFAKYQDAWNHARIALRLPDRPIEQRRWVHDFCGGVPNRDFTFPGMPLCFIGAFLGMIAAAARPRRLCAVHIAWVLTMLGDLYVVSMVAVTNGRFRFAYEPFALIYLFLLFDCIAEWIASGNTRHTHAARPPAPE